MKKPKKLLLLLLVGVVLTLIAGCLGAGPERAISTRERVHMEGARNYTLSDVEAEIEFGREVAAHILGTYPVLKNQAVTEYVNLVGTAMAMSGPRTELKFYFTILDTDNVNGFATPGGYIFITRGLLEKMESEAELAALIAHELAHINNRHIIKEMKVKGKDSDVIAGISQIVGASSSTSRAIFNKLVSASVEILFERGYKIEDEYESDRDAITLLAATGYDVNALGSLLKRVDKGDGNTGRGSLDETHPPTGERLSRLKGQIVKIGAADLPGKLGVARFSDNVMNNMVN